MIILIWTIFMLFNVILLLIILMNFLIAIVGQTYEIVKQSEMNNIFYFRSELCIEYIESYGVDGLSEEFSYILLLQEEATEDLELGISNRLYGLKK